jgi:hypothetical protein
MRAPSMEPRTMSGTGMVLDGADPLPPEDWTCSARGCQKPATFDLRWNNPKIHTPERRKHWLACDEHRESLSRFLGARGFLREIESLSPDR